MMAGFQATDRTVLRIGGADAPESLQNLVTNDVRALERGAVYAAPGCSGARAVFDDFTDASHLRSLEHLADDLTRPGWLAANLRRLLHRHLAEQGFVAFAMNYRLVPFHP